MGRETWVACPVRFDGPAVGVLGRTLLSTPDAGPPETVQKSGVLLILGTIALAAVVLFLVFQHPLAQTETTTVSEGACTSYSDTFTVVASQSGYNDSISHGVPAKPWPILCTHKGDLVRITIVNEDSVEPHGFSISNYLEAGVTVLPGRSTTITVFADNAGDFKIYCNVICAVHAFMQSGVLVVSS
jgi:heme/copper-type cytochrome/quinol oxidase subunit 2